MVGDELLFETAVRITKVVEYGISLEAIVAGSVVPPPEGARFDATVEGTIDGPMLKGSIHGVNYLTIRADGRVEAHIHAEVDLNDGERLTILTEGVGTFGPKGLLHLRESVKLTSHSPSYRWVNSIPVRADGTANLSTGEIRVREYRA